MSSSVNRTTLCGNVGQDAELRQTQSGQPYCYFRLATYDSYTDSTGMSQRSTEWHSCKIWGHTAHRAAEQLTKGTLVLLEGTLRSYKDNQQRRQWEVKVIKWWDLSAGQPDPFLPPEPEVRQTQAGQPPQHNPGRFGEGFNRR